MSSDRSRSCRRHDTSINTVVNALLYCQLGDADDVVHRLNGPAEVHAARDHKPAAHALPKKGPAQREDSADPHLAARPRRVEGPELHGELVGPRVAITDEFAGAGVEVLLGVLYAFNDAGGAGREDLHPRSRTLRRLDPVEPRPLVLATRARSSTPDPVPADRRRCCSRCRVLAWPQTSPRRCRPVGNLSACSGTRPIRCASAALSPGGGTFNAERTAHSRSASATSTSSSPDRPPGEQDQPDRVGP